MNRLPNFTTAACDDRHRLALTRWLHEFRVDANLEQAPPVPSSVVFPSTESSETHIESGQIRLLRPFEAASASRLQYFLLIDTPATHSWLAIPFSRYAEPATPEEWQRIESPPMVRVLCLWNRRSVDNTIGNRSWLIDSLSPAEVMAVRLILETSKMETGAEPGAMSHCGPPLVHPLDPRHEYLDIESESMNCLGPRVFEGRETNRIYSQIDNRPREMPKAAEDRGEYSAGDIDSP